MALDRAERLILKPQARAELAAAQVVGIDRLRYDLCLRGRADDFAGRIRRRAAKECSVPAVKTVETGDLLKDHAASRKDRYGKGGPVDPLEGYGPPDCGPCGGPGKPKTKPGPT